MNPKQSPANIEADIRGDVTGQVAVGAHILQIGSVHGGVVNVALPQEKPVPRARPTPIRLPPRPFPGLLDRTTETGTASAALLSARPVELIGEVGAGKTALIRHLAHHRLVTAFPDGVLYLYARGQSAGDLLHALFEAFYQCESPLKPSEPEIAHLLRGKQALVILDDLDLQREEIERVMNVAASCTFLWAGQERRGWGEVRAVSLGGIPLDATVELVERELERPLSSEERAEITTLWSATGGHPLRLLQAAGMVREDGVPLAEVVRRSRSEAVTDPAGPRVSEDQRRLLVLLAALGGALVTAGAAAALTGISGADGLLDTLERRGLVQRQGERYRVPETLLATTLRTSDATPWRRRALAYFTAWAEQAGVSPAEVAAEGDLLLRLLNLALESGEAAAAVRLGRRVEGAFALTGRWDCWQQVVEIVRRAAEAEDDTATGAWALHQLGTAALCTGEKEAAARALREALRQREAMGDSAGAAVTRHNLQILLGTPPGRAEGDDSGPGSGETLLRWRRALVTAGAGAAVVAAGLLLYGGGDDGEAVSLLEEYAFQVELEPASLLALDPGDVLFPEQEVGVESPPMAVRLTNEGESPLRLGRIELSGGSAFRIVEDRCAGIPELEPGGACILGISFLPAMEGAHEARLSVADGSGTPLSGVSLSGRGAARQEREPSPAVARVEPGSLNLGAHTVGSPGGSAEVRVRNEGGVPLQVTAVELEGGSEEAFRIIDQGCENREVSPLESCSISIAFTALAVGTREGSLLVHHDVQDPPLRVRLTGSGVARPEPAVDFSARELAFGEVQVGTTGALRQVRIRSVGEVPLALGAVDISGEHGGDFTVRSPDCTGSIGPGSDCTLQLRFTPGVPGRRRAELVVRGDFPGSPGRVSLQGIGTVPAIARAELDRDRVEFGERVVEDPNLLRSLLAALVTPQTVTVRSSGTGPLRVGNVTVAGAAAREFRVLESNCTTAPLEPGASCRIRLDFVPRETGTRSAVLVIEDNTSGSPHRVALVGQGTPRPARDATPPPTPRPLTGSGDPAQAAAARACGPTQVQWGGVSDPSAPVTYVVTSMPFAQARQTTGGTRWVADEARGAESSTRSTSAEITIPRPASEGRSVVGWNVRARDGAGNESPPSPWRYLQCMVIF